ncbi:WcaF family extracellular polysaccharide biosynthesis acetyltransferase [Algisphaera agarilytica]|uniref:Putative colanic acid biosynthesis acetyltransferase WcaF n=1 Tax=Algisphaera agarilytica TaxID=1385975 RepID=A0A7X0H830_9BACT|nr:WcaF family extracellular polysaccharide biosynthesis acetyltransferase [Algisphaera agarilytica]MBB6430792.1 putative colanic acid biosynthesis acetyltransferase WcaF [Algisphaera agarilytica]
MTTHADPASASAPDTPAEASPAATVDDRHISPWTTRQKIGRVLWWFVQATVWRWSWHSSYGYRRWVLRRFGATVDPAARIRPSVRIECPWNITLGANSVVGDFANLYALGRITIGDRVTVSQHVHLCAGTHDYTKPDFPLIKPPITIENDAWIAADAFVGPGVKIGKGAILGARGCAFKDMDSWSIYGGNPAKRLASRPASPAPEEDSDHV